MSALKLKKDSKFSLVKAAPTLRMLRVEAGWEKLQKTLDLDLSLFGLDKNGTAMESHVVFFNQDVSGDGTIRHSGDNRVGGEGVVESISIDLQGLKQKTPHVVELSLIMTIDRAISRGHNFGLLRQAFIRLVDAQTDQVIVEYDLDAQFGNCISVQLGSVIQNQEGAWEFKEVATGYPDKDFEAIAHAYGL